MVGDVRYPPFLNPKVPWPTGVEAYQKVGEEDDRILLHNWWDGFVRGSLEQTGVARDEDEEESGSDEEVSGDEVSDDDFDEDELEDLIQDQEYSNPVNVVVFNGRTASGRWIRTSNPIVGILTPSPSPKDSFSLPYDQFLSDVTPGVLAAYSGLQRAVESFNRAEEGQPTVFIATSNTLGVTRPVASLTALGSQKKQLAYFVESGHQTYNDFRFYLATQVNSRGGSPGKELSSEAHAIAYWDLIQRKEKGGWDIRFLKDGSILVEN
ncbi:hypothetical protein CPB86DRAFT_830669 [Serendipita vermifera]|nr:hypothetical protein CPB86DRAFT_830669 [Serendipita vermifera]